MTRGRLMTEEDYAAHQKRVKGPAMIPMIRDAEPGLRGKDVTYSMQTGLPLPKRRKHGNVPTVLYLPWPPTVNHYYGVKTGGGKYIKEPGKTFRWRAKAAMLETGGSKATGRLSVRIVANPPDKRRRDLDNLLKCLLDALQHAGCYDDDEQIDRLLIERREVVAGGRLTVFIEQLTVNPAA